MNRIWIVGLGLSIDDLTQRAMKMLRSGSPVLLRTARIESARWLDDEGIPYDSLDSLYDRAVDFDELDMEIQRAIDERLARADLVYGAVDIRDLSVQSLIKRHGTAVILIPGVPVDACLTAYAPGGYRSLSASDWQMFRPDAATATLAREIDSRELASELKLRLMERYPSEHAIYCRTTAGAVEIRPLYALDRLGAYDHRVSALIPAVEDIRSLERYGFDDLNAIVKRLRAPGGCPWDQKQTHQSIRMNVVEEAYEVVDAIDRDDADALYDELGDLLLQVVFHADIARAHGKFAIDDVVTAVCEKLISRHPHIFGSAKADTPEEVLELWEQAKKKEKRVERQGDNMRAITKGLPALLRAEKVQKKAADVGFDWDGAKDALFKVREEMDEVNRAIEENDNFKEEIGDLLFAVVNVSRLMKVGAEHALMAAIDKFVGRFSRMEEKILADGKELEAMSLDQMDGYWDAVKEEMRKTM